MILSHFALLASDVQPKREQTIRLSSQKGCEDDEALWDWDLMARAWGRSSEKYLHGRKKQDSDGRFLDKYPDILIPAQLPPEIETTWICYPVADQIIEQGLMLPCHPPRHAQVDFGEAVGVIGGVRRKIHFFYMDLPQSDACFVKAYPAETTEAFLDGDVSAFAFFGGVPMSILYDNTKIAVAKICGDVKRERTRAFTGLISHYLKQLKLPTVLREYEKLAGECARQGGAPPAEAHRIGADRP